MYWDAVLKEVLNKHSSSHKFSFTNIKTTDVIKIKKNRRNPQKFPLGEKYKNVYFTSREAEVMLGLLQGKTLFAVALSLGLSPRTIEFYVKNMKSKVNCRTKSELIGKIFHSDFIKNIDFLALLQADETAG